MGKNNLYKPYYGIEITYNIHENDYIVIQVNVTLIDKTKKIQEEEKRPILTKQGFM